MNHPAPENSPDRETAPNSAALFHAGREAVDDVRRGARLRLLGDVLGRRGLHGRVVLGDLADDHAGGEAGQDGQEQLRPGAVVHEAQGTVGEAPGGSDSGDVTPDTRPGFPAPGPDGYTDHRYIPFLQVLFGQRFHMAGKFLSGFVPMLLSQNPGLHQTG